MEMEIDQIEELYNKIPQQVIIDITTKLEQYVLGHSRL